MYVLISKKKFFSGLLLCGALLAMGTLALLHGHTPHQATLSWHIADKTFVIDPGHGGIFPGKVSTDGILEKDINLAIARELNSLLQESGSVTVLTRNSDIDLVPASEAQSKMILRQRADLGQRTAIAAASNADLFISIHCNSIPSAKWSGAQTFYAPDNAESARLGLAIQNALISQLKNTDRQAIVRKDTFLFRNLSIPAVIVECGFLSNTAETQLLLDPAYQKKIAYAIFCGISDYLSSGHDVSRHHD